MHWHPNRFWAFLIVVWLWLAGFFCAYGLGWRPDRPFDPVFDAPNGYIIQPASEPIYVPIGLVMFAVAWPMCSAWKRRYWKQSWRLNRFWAAVIFIWLCFASMFIAEGLGVDSSGAPPWAMFCGLVMLVPVWPACRAWKRHYCGKQILRRAEYLSPVWVCWPQPTRYRATD